MLDMKMWKVHICYLVLGCLLLATSPTHAQGLETTRYTMGGWQTFENYNLSTACELTLPNGAVCSYDNSFSTTPAPTEICSFPNYLPPYGGYCNIEVSITTKPLSGIYTLKYRLTNSTFGVDTFYVYLQTDSVPSGELQIVESENMYFLLEDSFGSADDRKCEAIYWNGTHEFSFDSSWTSSNHWGKEDQCGFKIENVSTSDGHVWKLRMSSNGAAYTYADFNVVVIPLDEISTGEEAPQVWILGRDETLSGSTNGYIDYCELWNPKKEMVRKGSFCSYTQSLVTDADEGNWTFVYGFEGMLLADIAVQEVTVITINLEVSVSSSEIFANGISLLCRLNAAPVEDCSFTRPDGRLLLPSEGTGNADYSYFGEGFERGDCGLTIHNVKDNDKGMWKCTVADGLTTTFGFLNVSANDVKVDTSRSLVVVQGTDTLYLSCSAQTTIKYCRFRHPSGVFLRFSTDGVYVDDFWEYSYEDTLPQGVCTISVRYPNSNMDSGVWTCNVRLSENSTEEYSVPITVRFSETDVISLEKEVVVSEDSAVLKCYSVPLETPLHYCHFIRPDGIGFIFDPQNNGSTVLGRYKYEGGGLNMGECGLRIVSGINKDEDVGKWTCVAKLQTSNIEGRDFITLKEEVDINRSVVVVQGTEVLSLSCSTQTTAEYCWFWHPSGLPLSFSTERVELDEFRGYSYEDTLPQGVCTIRVESPQSYMDSGLWTCNVRLSENSTEEYSFPIRVGFSETDVISFDKEVVVSEDSALLKCYSVPLETPLHYCRFIRPDGKGFIFDPQNNGITVLGRYKYEGGGLNMGECGLRIISGINKDEDLGKWTCVARLQRSNREGQDFITLKEEGY